MKRKTGWSRVYLISAHAGFFLDVNHARYNNTLPTALQSAHPTIMSSKPSKTLTAFPNPCPDRDFLIHMEIPEFTCLCPMTGQPDFATLFLDYIADRKCVELKSLKLYIWSYRNQGVFHEAVTNRILDDLVKALSPRFMRLTSRFYVRGGIHTTVVAEHRKKGWKLQPKVELHSFESAPSVRD
jgi:7-cyano-7-deazaguanine reductase